MWFSTAISTRMPPHTHDAFEVNLVVAGRLEYRTEEGLVAARAGQCVLLPAGIVHELVDASPDLALWVLEWRHGSVVLAGETAPVLAARVVELSDEDAREMGRLARDLWMRPGPVEGEALTAALLERLTALRPGVAPRRGSHPGVLRARACAEAVESEQLDVARLARAAALSPSRLAHLFQDEVGVSPLQYLNYCRVQAFVRRWDGEQRTLLAAALAAGFGSYAKFHRVFSQVCGSSPRDHRRFLSERAIDPARQLRSREPLERPQESRERSIASAGS